MERERCEKHDCLLIEKFDESTPGLMVPTGEFSCWQCDAESGRVLAEQNAPDGSGPLRPVDLPDQEVREP